MDNKVGGRRTDIKDDNGKHMLNIWREEADIPVAQGYIPRREKHTGALRERGSLCSLGRHGCRSRPNFQLAGHDLLGADQEYRESVRPHIERLQTKPRYKTERNLKDSPR